MADSPDTSVLPSEENKHQVIVFREFRNAVVDCIRIDMGDTSQEELDASTIPHIDIKLDGRHNVVVKVESKGVEMGSLMRQREVYSIEVYTAEGALRFPVSAYTLERYYGVYLGNVDPTTLEERASGGGGSYYLRNTLMDNTEQPDILGVLEQVIQALRQQSSTTLTNKF